MAPREDNSFKDFILEQLSGLKDIRCIRMFGGYGLYQDKIFFGIISKGRLYFKTDETTRSSYKAHGMQSFQPSPKQTLKNYYEVPPDIMEDQEELVRWAEEAREN